MVPDARAFALTGVALRRHGYTHSVVSRAVLGDRERVLWSGRASEDAAREAARERIGQFARVNWRVVEAWVLDEDGRVVAHEEERQ